MIEDEDVDTIGGWLFKELEGSPAKGKIREQNGYVFEVEESTRLRINRVKVYKQMKDPDTSAEAKNGDPLPVQEEDHNNK